MFFSVTVGQSQAPQYWLVSMKVVQDQIRQCHSSGQQLVLRGGGGGGGGFGALMPGEELPQMAFNYGFELLGERCFHHVFSLPKLPKMDQNGT